MGLVFEHTPWAGGPLTLALKLADNAHDDGRHIFPSIGELATKTKQSMRTVQRQLRAMEESGWLVCEVRSSGGRNRSSRYRIAAPWVADPAAFAFRQTAIDAPPVPADEASNDQAGAALEAASSNARVRETVTRSGACGAEKAATKPRQNVAVCADVPPPKPRHLEHETMTPASGAYNHQEPLQPPLSPFIDAEQSGLIGVDLSSKPDQAVELDARIGVGGEVQVLATRPARRAEVIDPDDQRLAEWMFGLVLALRPEHRPPPWRRWARAIRLMRERDKRSRRDIAALFRWANADPFWHANILSPDTLREKWDRLMIERQRKAAPTMPGPATVQPGNAIAIDRRCRYESFADAHDGKASMRYRCKCRGVRSLGLALDAPWYCAEHLEQIEREHAIQGGGR